MYVEKEEEGGPPWILLYLSSSPASRPRPSSPCHPTALSSVPTHPYSSIQPGAANQPTAGPIILVWYNRNQSYPMAILYAKQLVFFEISNSETIDKLTYELNIWNEIYSLNSKLYKLNFIMVSVIYWDITVQNRNKNIWIYVLCMYQHTGLVTFIGKWSGYRISGRILNSVSRLAGYPSG